MSDSSSVSFCFKALASKLTPFAINVRIRIRSIDGQLACHNLGFSGERSLICPSALWHDQMVQVTPFL